MAAHRGAHPTIIPDTRLHKRYKALLRNFLPGLRESPGTNTIVLPGTNALRWNVRVTVVLRPRSPPTCPNLPESKSTGVEENRFFCRGHLLCQPYF